MKHIRLLILFLILGITTLSAQKSPKREFRGAWIQTVFQSEYAKMTPEEMNRRRTGTHREKKPEQIQVEQHIQKERIEQRKERQMNQRRKQQQRRSNN